MKFFSRCRLLCGILTAADVILGIIIAFRIPDIIDKYSGANPLINSLLVSLFFIILLAVIILKCVIKDAEEDLSAVLNLTEIAKNSKNT